MAAATITGAAIAADASYAASARPAVVVAPHAGGAAYYPGANCSSSVVATGGASLRPTADAVAFSPQALEQLVEMGFAREAAQWALQRADGSVEAAVALLAKDAGGSGGGGGGGIDGSSSSSSRVMRVRLPGGAHAGQTMHVESPEGHTIGLVVPPGVGGGSVIEVSYELPAPPPRVVGMAVASADVPGASADAY